MMAVATDNCESGIPGMDEPHNHSLRWHVEWEGRTFIVYKDSPFEACIAFSRHFGTNINMALVKPSGYYCQRANAIYQAKDGPTVLLDNSNGRLT